jgi:hypothetical protein
MNHDFDQYEIVSGYDEPIEAGDMTVEYRARTLRQFGTGLVWHVIPAEYLYSREDYPQVKV